VPDKEFFRDRLAGLLAARHPKGGQAWLAKVSGAERSTISRILKGRIPSLETLEMIAPALGLSVEELVRGTDAETKARPGSDFVPSEQLKDAIDKMLEFERRANDAEERSRQQARTAIEETERRKRREDDVERLERLLRARDDELAKARREVSHLQHQVRRRTQALEKAVKELNELRARLADLTRTVQEGRWTQRAATFLAAIAAFTGVVTVANYLGRDDDEEVGEEDKEGSSEREA
jgi:transcriptional regulator with XRE-family HTH domain